MQTAALHNHACLTIVCLSLLVLFLRERNSSYHDNKTTYTELNIVQLIKLSINKDTHTYFYDAILQNKIQLKTHCNSI